MSVKIKIVEDQNGEIVGELALKPDLKLSDLFNSISDSHFAITDSDKLFLFSDITILDDRVDFLVNFDNFNWVEYLSIQGKVIKSEKEISEIIGKKVVVQSKSQDGKWTEDDVILRSNLYYEELVLFIPLNKNITLGEIYNLGLKLHSLIERIVADVKLISKDITSIKKPNRLNWNIKLFVSHSSKDKVFVRKLTSSLKKNKGQSFSVWFDEDSILVGHDFIEQIEKGIRESDFMILVMSKNFVENGPWAKEEYKIALSEQIEKNKTKILPILLDDCNIPLFLKSKHYADFRKDFKFGFNKLISTLRKIS